MKKKILALTLLASLVLTFAACGEDTADTSAKSDNSTPASSNSQSSNTPDSSTPAPSNPGASNPGPTNPGPSNPGSEISAPMFSNDEVEYFVVKGKAEIDGEKDEAWNKAQTVKLELVKKDNPSLDTVVEVSAMWDEDAIYFLFEIQDTQIFNGGALGDYNNDGIYLYIAEDVELVATTADAYGYGAYQFALISPELEMLPRRGDTGAEMNAHSAYNKTKDGMTIEFSYKFTDFDLAANRFIAMDFQYNDCEESGVRLGALSWYNSTDGDFNTMNLAICKLVETLPN